MPSPLRQQESGLKVSEEQPGDKVSVLQPGPLTWDLPSQEVTECLRAGQECKTSGSTDPKDLASFGEEEDDGSMKLKDVGWWEAIHNENECRDFPSGPEKKCDRYRIGQCAAVEEDPESSPTEPPGERGTGALCHAAEQNACLLHENGSDQSMYSCSSPTDGGGDDLENLAASSSLQARFDMEVLEAHENDNLDVVVTTVQHSKTALRPDVQVEPSEEVPDNSESITSAERIRREKRDRIGCSRWSAGRQRSEDAVERCRWIGSECEISRKNREAAEKQT